jgi:hypothetical protein
MCSEYNLQARFSDNFLRVPSSQDSKMPGSNYGSITADSTLKMEGAGPFEALAAVPNYSGRMLF